MGENTDKPPVKSQLFSQELSGGEIENEKNEGDMRNSVGGKNLFFCENPKQAPSGPGSKKEGCKRTCWYPVPEEECESWVPMLPMCRADLKS